jgi:hypothetical protein
MKWIVRHAKAIVWWVVASACLVDVWLMIMLRALHQPYLWIVAFTAMKVIGLVASEHTDRRPE